MSDQTTTTTALVFLGQDDPKSDGVCVTSVEFESLPGSRKCDLIGAWIDHLRVLYCYCREEAEADVDPEQWSFLEYEQA